MTKRVYVSYDESSLRTLVASWKDDALSKLATLFNYRNHPSASDVSDVVSFRNVVGDLFELRIDAANNRLRTYSTSGGVYLGTIDIDVIVDPIFAVEMLTRDWSNGIVYCGDCRTPMRRFSPDIVLAYHGGRYCATCAPRYERLAASEID